MTVDLKTLSIVRTIATLLIVCLAVTAGAQETPVADNNGQVQIPLELYNQLVRNSQRVKPQPRPVPASYALGSAEVNVNVDAGGENRGSAQISVNLTVRVLEDEWMLVPVLPAGTPVESAVANGNTLQLITTPDGLMWSTNKSGSYNVVMAYRVDATSSAGGASLAIPLPQAASIRLNANLPGSGLDVSVIPSAGTRTNESGSRTTVQATVPTTNGVQLAWRLPSERGHAVSRAAYSGQLQGEAVVWTGELQVELLSDEALTLPLLPRSVTLSQLLVDGRSTPILVEGNNFATLIRGRGQHTVEVGFEVGVDRDDGPPSITLDVPVVPVSRFELLLPGKKELEVDPLTNVIHQARGQATLASFHIPMTSQVSMSWSEAVPEAVRTEVRMNAEIYHAVHAEEGALLVRALAALDVTRGETSTLQLEVPPEVLVNRMSSPSGAVSDWRVEPVDGRRLATVFFDRKVSGEILVEIEYDRSTASDQTESAEVAPLRVPLIRALDTHRQRGMVALLQSKDWTLNPSNAEGATPVGENQLPAFVRNAIEMTVAHTYRYVEDTPAIDVEVTVPDRQQGRFDAQVDTLISLGDVSMKGQASVELNVKSGQIMDLVLGLPDGVNLLHLTGPSVRKHTPETLDGGGQEITVEFTQEMEGQFRLEVAYERLLADGETRSPVPTLSVEGAEVEQGRLAVEALSAVEVQPANVAQMTLLDLTELPQQLILRTTNPILMAYKYVRADAAPQLDLTVTRHDVIDVQEATIDSANYTTLYTKDGLAVTTARFFVRNSREQFLRVDLPDPDAEVWSVFVDGRPEKPAQGEIPNGRRGQRILIKIIHSTEGFPVELIYKTKSDKIGGLFGSSITGQLPHPDDILVTNTRWDVYVPADISYDTPTTNMEVVSQGVMTAEEAARAEAALQAGDGQAIEPLRLTVPKSGTHFAFEKLYANQSADEPARIVIPYASDVGSSFGGAAVLLGTLLFWVGLVGIVRRRRLGLGIRWATVQLIAGAALILLMVEHYHVSARPAFILSLLITVALAAYAGRGLLGRWRSSDEEEE